MEKKPKPETTVNPPPPDSNPPAKPPLQLSSDSQVQKIEDLARDAAAVDSEKQLFTPEKRRRGPRGPYKKRGDSDTVQNSSAQPTNGEAGSVQAPPAIPSSEIVKPTINVVDAWMVKIARNPKAAMLPEEKDGICKSLGMVLDKWAPIFVQQHAPEIMAVMAISAYGTRVYAIMKHDAEIRAAEYAAKVEAQQRDTVQPDAPKDPNPNLNGHDQNPPMAKTQRYGNPFAKLPQPH